MKKIIFINSLAVFTIPFLASALYENPFAKLTAQVKHHATMLYNYTTSIPVFQQIPTTIQTAWQQIATTKYFAQIPVSLRDHWPLLVAGTIFLGSSFCFKKKKRKSEENITITDHAANIHLFMNAVHWIINPFTKINIRPAVSLPLNLAKEKKILSQNHSIESASTNIINIPLARTSGEEVTKIQELIHPSVQTALAWATEDKKTKSTNYAFLYKTDQEYGKNWNQLFNKKNITMLYALLEKPAVLQDELKEPKAKVIIIDCHNADDITTQDWITAWIKNYRHPDVMTLLIAHEKFRKNVTTIHKWHSMLISTLSRVKISDIPYTALYEKPVEVNKFFSNNQPNNLNILNASVVENFAKLVDVLEEKFFDSKDQTILIIDCREAKREVTNSLIESYYDLALVFENLFMILLIPKLTPCESLGKNGFLTQIGEEKILIRTSRILSRVPLKETNQTNSPS
jgi:hypothetical protein